MTTCKGCGGDFAFISPENGKCSNCIEVVHLSHRYDSPYITGKPHAANRIGRCLKCRLWNDHSMNKFPCDYVQSLEKKPDPEKGMTVEAIIDWCLKEENACKLDHAENGSPFETGYIAALQRVRRMLMNADRTIPRSQSICVCGHDFNNPTGCREK